MGCFQSDKPADLKYGKIMADTLRTQVGLEPLLLSSQAEFQPAQTNLALANLNDLLFGSPEQDLGVQTFTPAVYQTGGRLHYGAAPKDWLGAVSKPTLPTWQNGKWVYPSGTGKPTGASSAGGVTIDAATGRVMSPTTSGVTPVNPGTLAGRPGLMDVARNPLKPGDQADLFQRLGDPSNLLKSATNPMGFVSSIFGGSEPETVRLAGPQTTTSLTRLGAQRGLIDLANQANTTTRAATVGDIASLGPEAVQALLAAYPEMGGLIDTLNRQAQEGLDAGSGLTPEETRLMQQASRASWAARGLSGSDASAADEILRQYALGQQLMRQRQQFAQGVVAQNKNVLQDPMLALLTAGNGGGAVGQAQGMAGGPMFNPESPFAGNIAAANQQMAALFADPSTMQKINMTANTVGNIFGAVGKVAGGVAAL